MIVSMSFLKLLIYCRRLFISFMYLSKHNVCMSHNITGLTLNFIRLFPLTITSDKIHVFTLMETIFFPIWHHNVFCVSSIIFCYVNTVYKV